MFTFRYIKRMSKHLFAFLGRFSSARWVLVFFVISIVSVNLLVWGKPFIENQKREKKIQVVFDTFWNKEGADKFKRVGLEPTRELYLEEFNAYREKFLSKNPPLDPNIRVQKMTEDFKTWWETGGNLSYVNQGIAPTKELYNTELKRRLKAYTDTQLLFTMPLIPAEENLEKLFSYWILFPSFISLFIFVVVFIFASFILEKRWGLYKTLGIFLLANLTGGFMTYLLSSTSFFHSFSNDYLKGSSLGLAVLLGGVSMGYYKKAVPKVVLFFASLLFSMDVLCNWFYNERIYIVVAILSFAFLGVGVLLGLKIPPRKKTKQELQKGLLLEKKKNNGDLYLEKKKKTRENIEEGLKAAKNAEFEAASEFLSKGVQALLQESPLDEKFIESIASQITHSSFFIELPSIQWQEWGNTANNKKLPKVALLFLEKALTIEKEAIHARRTLFQIGEIRLHYKLNPEEGIQRLRKVVELNGDDFVARQANKLMGNAKIT